MDVAHSAPSIIEDIPNTNELNLSTTGQYCIVYIHGSRKFYTVTTERVSRPKGRPSKKQFPNDRGV